MNCQVAGAAAPAFQRSRPLGRGAGQQYYEAGPGAGGRQAVAGAAGVPKRTVGPRPARARNGGAQGRLARIHVISIHAGARSGALQGRKGQVLSICPLLPSQLSSTRSSSSGSASPPSRAPAKSSRLAGGCQELGLGRRRRAPDLSERERERESTAMPSWPGPALLPSPAGTGFLRVCSRRGRAAPRRDIAPASLSAYPGGWPLAGSYGPDDAHSKDRVIDVRVQGSCKSLAAMRRATALASAAVMSSPRRATARASLVGRAESPARRLLRHLSSVPKACTSLAAFADNSWCRLLRLDSHDTGFTASAAV